MNVDDLSSALREIAQDHWKIIQQPVLLSGVPTRLQEKLGGDYKEVLGGESLKSFIKTSGSKNGYQLVEHPTQRAKLGLIPGDVVFEFPEDEAKDVPLSSALTKQDIDGFVKVLKCLTAEELTRVTLPASLLVKLLSNE